MARKRARKRKRAVWLLYLAAIIGLALFAVWGWNWWIMREWKPDSAIYPEQGVFLGQQQGSVRFETVRAIGGQFAYLEASRGDKGKDTRFPRNLRSAQSAGLQVGAVHQFDPCLPADGQSANFVTMVPRDASLLPPVIVLEAMTINCPERVNDAAVESELLTFINQVEMHASKRAILKISPAFEARYDMAQRIERDIWLVKDRRPPTYAGRPWLLWSANRALESEASAKPLEWVVVQP